MHSRNQTGEAVTAWLDVPHEIEKAIAGLADSDLDLRGGTNGWSIRETVHHLVEANLVASNIIIAALAASGCTFDWSWVNPDDSWMKRVGYSAAPVGPAVKVLASLGPYIGGLVNATADASEREVKLLDAPGTQLYSMTIEQVIRQEVEHAKEHLRDVAQTRKQHQR